MGIWRPDSTALGKVRDAIVERGNIWLNAVNDEKFKQQFNFSGESLKNAPRGYDKTHPLIDDLKRKDFIAIKLFDCDDIFKKNFKKRAVNSYADAEPYMKFLCQALALNY